MITAILNKKEYNIAKIGDTEAKLLIGGKDETTEGAFVPNLNCSWECFSGSEKFFLNLNRRDVVAVTIESLVDGKITSPTGDSWETAGDTIKWNVSLDKQPPSNKFTWDLLHSPAIQLFYQPSLEEDWKAGIHISTSPGCSLGEYLEKHHRPDNVTGSYAIYCDRRNAIKGRYNYKTGQLGRVYRPKCSDADKKSVWCKLVIERLDVTHSRMVVEIPQDFLDSAVYPVILDPDIGYKTIGGTTGGVVDRGYVDQTDNDVTDANGGEPSVFYLYTNGDWTPGSASIGIYALDGTDPGNLIANCPKAWAAGFTDNNWSSIDISGDNWGTLAASTSYYVAHARGTGSGGDIAYNTGLGASFNLYYKNAENPLPATWDKAGDDVTAGASISMYCEYTAESSSSSSSSSQSTSVSSSSSSQSISVSSSSSSQSVSVSSSSSSSSQSISTSISSSSSSTSISTSVSSSSSSTSISSSSSSSSQSISQSSSSSSSSCSLDAAKLYSRGDYAGLPAGDANLETPFTCPDYPDVAVDDNIYVQQSATDEYVLFLWKNQHGDSESGIIIQWKGKSDRAPSVSTVYLQIYNRNTPVWETLDSDNATAADTEFVLSGKQAINLDQYYDGSNWVSCRVYQQAA